MKSLGKDYYNPIFSHIYLEKKVREYRRTREILSHFPSSHIIEIDHYKDIFCRRGQDYIRQHQSKKLILAAKQGQLLYQGAPVCQNFGNEHFYYTSCIMNCIFDCEYCYLKGMYPSANLVVFVNLEDIFAQTKQLLRSHPVYLCVSYDTDLLGMERITGYVGAWKDFAAKHDNLKIEVRTKCADRKFFLDSEPSGNMIYAFTLSPQTVAETYEHQVPSLSDRIACAAEAVRLGYPVRLCFDPMIYHADWRQCYDAMLDEICSVIDMNQILDVSIGTFRISKDYLKNMRKQMPDSAIVWFPYQNEAGYYHYPDELMWQMEQHLFGRLEKMIGKEKIFLWK